MQFCRLIVSYVRNWPKKKKVLVACKHITLYDIPACSQKLTWSLLWLFLDWRSPRATCTSEQMGLINHLIMSFPRHFFHLCREASSVVYRGDCASQNAIFQLKYVASFLHPFSSQFYSLASSFHCHQSGAFE